MILVQPNKAASIICHLCWEQDSNNAYLIYKYVVERILESTSGKTVPLYRSYFQVLENLLEMEDSFQIRRVQHCLPHLIDRCPRLSDRQAPGDEEFLFDVSRLCMYLGVHAPKCSDLIRTQLAKMKRIRPFY